LQQAEFPTPRSVERKQGADGAKIRYAGALLSAVNLPLTIYYLVLLMVQCLVVQADIGTKDGEHM
jgi:hypothetical protein